jgi:hypothetical protein
MSGLSPANKDNISLAARHYLRAANFAPVKQAFRINKQQVLATAPNQLNDCYQGASPLCDHGK